jgi:DNA mismatch repair ATPase MutS
MLLAAPSLTLRSSRGQSMHVHIGRSKRDAGALRTSPLFAKVSESGSTCVFVHQAWTVLGAQLLEAAAAIASAERAAFEQLRADVDAHAAPIRRTARVIDELDVALGFAELAAEMGWVRPEMTDEYVRPARLGPARR